MTDRPGRLWALIQEWLDTFRYRPPSQRQLAPRLGVSASSLSDYKYGRTLPPPAFLARLADEMQMPYERVLDAALEDSDYRGAGLQRIREELMGNAEHPAPTSAQDERAKAAAHARNHVDATEAAERRDESAERPA